jgi:hypothetical protein
MSTRTLVTKTATTLTAIQRNSATVTAAHYTPADVAAFNAAIIYDNNTTLHAYQSLQFQGYLIIPGRGELKVLPGDVLAWDLNGWPILISGQSIAANNSWTLT